MLEMDLDAIQSGFDAATLCGHSATAHRLSEIITRETEPKSSRENHIRHIMNMAERQICEAMGVESFKAIDRDDKIRSRVISNLMCNFELDFEAVEEAFDIEFESYFEWGLANLKDMIDDGLVVVENKMLKVNPMGRLLIRNIAMNFDGYIERQADSARYSRTI